MALAKIMKSSLCELVVYSTCHQNLAKAVLLFPSSVS